MTWRGKKIGRKILLSAAAGILAYSGTGALAKKFSKKPLNHTNIESTGDLVKDFAEKANPVFQAAAQGNYLLAAQLRDTLEQSWADSRAPEAEIKALKQLGPILRELIDVQVEINRVLDEGYWSANGIGNGTMKNIQFEYLKAARAYQKEVRTVSPDVRRILEPWLVSRHAELQRRLEGILRGGENVAYRNLLNSTVDVTTDFIATS